MADCRLYFGRTGDNLVIKISGRGTWSDARVFKQIVDELLNREWKDCYLNLKDCTYLDSTFIGIIAYALKKFKVLQRTMIILCAQTEVFEILKTMGVTKFACVLEKHEIDVCLQEVMNIADNLKKEDARFVLQAHEQLEELDESNIDRFRFLKTVLKEKIDKE